MKKILFVFFIQFFSANLFAQPNNKNIEGRKVLYEQAKAAIADYEKKHGHFIKTKNVKMHYLTWGNPSGIPLIWAHGSFTNGYEMMSMATQLTAAGYYLIAIDYYGHGQTPISTHEVSLYHVADDIKFLMDQLSIKKAVIGGWSRGGSIATAFYDAYPGSVLALILEDGGSVTTNTYYHQMDSVALSNRITQIFKDRMPDKTYTSELDAYSAIYDTAEKGSQFELLGWIRENKEGKFCIGEGLLKLFNMSNNAEFLDNILRPTKVPLFAESMAVLEPKIVYRNLQVPMLILDPTSKNDLFPFELANDALQKSHPRLIMHRIYENTGHNIHYERREQFVKDVTSFTKEIRLFNKLK